MKYPVIADSGANYHMFKEKEFFMEIHPAQGNVLLGDGRTSIKIQGIGTVKCFISGNEVTIPNIRYIPELGESIYSLFVHIRSQNHGLESTTDQGLFINFPNFKSLAIIGKNDIYLDIKPFNEASESLLDVDDQPSSTLHLRHLTDLPCDTHNLVSSSKDQLLPELRQYYKDVKTRRQLKLDVPAGFRQLTSTQRHFTTKTPPRKSTDGDQKANTTSDDSFNLFSSLSSTLPPTSDLISEDVCDAATVVTSNVTNSDELSAQTSNFIPIIRSVDKPSSSLPNTMSMSEDYLKSCVGFRRVDTLKRQFSTLYKSSVKFDDTPPDAIINQGQFATMRKKACTTVPVS
jgi:hypothetical protein